MKRRRLRFSILAVLVLMTVVAIAFAVIAARPSATIRMTVHGNGDVSFQSRTYSTSELKTVVAEAVAHRERWFVETRAQINFEPDVSFHAVPRVMSLLQSAGCEEIQIGLPAEMSSHLSHPELTSEPW